MTVHHSQDMRHCVDTLVQQVVHTAGAETVNQKAVQDTFHSGNVYAHALWEKVSA